MSLYKIGQTTKPPHLEFWPDNAMQFYYTFVFVWPDNWEDSCGWCLVLLVLLLCDPVWVFQQVQLRLHAAPPTTQPHQRWPALYSPTFIKQTSNMLLLQNKMAELHRTTMHLFNTVFGFISDADFPSLWNEVWKNLYLVKGTVSREKYKVFVNVELQKVMTINRHFLQLL